MAKGFVFTEEDDDFLLGGSSIKEPARPKAEANKKQKPVFLFSEEDDAFLFGADYGKSKEPASGGIGSSDAASTAPVQRREEQGLQPDRQVVTNAPWVGKFGQAPQFATENPSIADVPTAVVDIAEATPALYRESNRAADYGRALREYEQTGRITLEQPKLSNQFAVARFGQAPVYEGGKVLEGAEAAQYLAELSAPTEDAAKAEGFRRSTGLVTRSIAGALSQPEQFYSLAGGIAGGLVGQPMAGAMLGMTHLLEKMVYSEYGANRAAGLSKEEAWNNALAKLPAEALTEMIPGMGKVAKAGVLGTMAAGGAEESAAEVLGMGVDKAFQMMSETPEAYEQKLPQSFGEGLAQVVEAGVGGTVGAGAIRAAANAPAAAIRGVESATNLIRSAREKAGLKPELDVEPIAKPKIPEILPRVDIEETADGKFRVAQQTESGTSEAIFSSRKDAEAFASKQKPTPAKEPESAKVKAPSKKAYELASADIAERLQSGDQTLLDVNNMRAERERLAAEYDLKLTIEKEAKQAEKSKAAVTPSEPVVTPPATPVAPTPTEVAVEAPSAPTERVRRTTPVTRQDMLRDSGMVAPPAEPTGPLTPEQRRARGAGLSRAEALGMRPEVTTETPPRATITTPEQPATTPATVTPIGPLTAEQRRARLAEVSQPAQNAEPIAATSPEVTTVSTNPDLVEATRLAGTYSSMLSDLGQGATSWADITRQYYSELMADRGIKPGTEEATTFEYAARRDPTIYATGLKDFLQEKISQLTPFSEKARIKRVTDASVAGLERTETVENVNDARNDIATMQSGNVGRVAAPATRAANERPLSAVPDIAPVVIPQTQETTNGLQQIQEGQRTQGRGQEAVEVSQPDLGPTPEFDLSVSKQPTDTSGNYTSKGEFTTELESGFMDVDATEAKKIKDKIVLYDSQQDLASIDPAVATAVEQGVKKVDPNASFDQIKGFQHNGKVYINTSKNKKGSAKSIILHEARVHLAGKSEPERVGSLASRVEALARLGNADAVAATETVLKEYPAIVEAAGKGNASALSRQKEEVLADFVQRVWERTKGGKGLVGTVKRLYTDALSYFRDKISSGLKSMGAKVGKDWGLTINDTDILDAIRYGRTAASFKNAPEAQITTPDTEAPSFAKSAKAPTPKPIPPKKVKPRFGKQADFVRASQTLLRKQGAGSEAVFELGQRAGGEVSAWLWEMQNSLLNAQERLGSRWKLYQGEIAKHFQGQTSNLPKDIRSVIDATIGMTRDKGVVALIASGAVQSKNEAKKILDSVGRYVHRSYAAWEMPKGQWVELLRAPGGGFDRLVDSVLGDIKADLALPSPDIIADMYSKMNDPNQKKKARKLIKDTLTFKMQAHGIIPPNNKKEWEQRIEVLKEASKEQAANPDYLTQMARDIAERVVDPREDSKEFREAMAAFGVDASALKKRTGVRPWMRELWGEYTQPDALAISTISNLAGMIARENAMRRYKQELIEKGILIEGTKKAGPRSGYQMLSGKEYGVFNGYYVRNEEIGVINLIADNRAMEAVFQYTDALIGSGFGSTVLSKISAASKINQILLDYTALILNASTSMGILTLAAGNPAVLLQAPKTGRLVRSADFRTLPFLKQGLDYANVSDAELIETIKFLATENVLFDTALTQDLKQELHIATRDEAYEYAPRLKRWLFKGGVAWGGVKDAASRLQSGGDSAAKLMMYFAKIPFLKRIYPDKSDLEINKLAAKEVRDQMPSYARTAPIARAISRIGLIGPFAPFYSEIYRTSVNDIRLATEYLSIGVKEKNPHAALYGGLILAGMTAKHSAIAALHGAAGGAMYGVMKLGAMAAAGIADALGGDDEEPEDEEQKLLLKQIEDGRKAQINHYDAIRKMMPEYMKGDIVVTRQLDRNKFMVVSTNRWDPSMVGAMVSAYNNKADALSIAQIAVEGFIGPSIPVSTVLQAFRAAPEDRMETLTLGAIRMNTPGTLNRTVVNPLEDMRKGQEPLSVGEKVLEYGTGTVVQEIDLEQGLARYARTFGEPIKEATREFSELFHPKIRVVTDFYKIDDDVLATRYNAVSVAHIKAFDDLYPMVLAMRDIGNSDEQIYKMLTREYTGLSSKFVNAVVRGKVYIPSPKDLIKNKAEEELGKVRSSQERERVLSKTNPAYERANDLYELAIEAAKKRGMQVQE